MAQPYGGYRPSNVNKDAKYTVRSSDGGYAICLLYRETSGDEYLLASDAHEDLVSMVNQVKKEVNGTEGGPFYINEYHHVLVPCQDSETYLAGSYSTYLTFPFKGGRIGPVAPSGVKPGDPWNGPHAGVPHQLAAGGNDIYRWMSGTNEFGEEWRRKDKLSVAVGASSARKLANRIAAIKGPEGGRVYVNEACELFSPPDEQGDAFIYLGHLDPDDWFPEPPSTDDG